MAHTHWEPCLLERLYVNPPTPPVCDMRTKAACDERHLTFLHGHLGTPCVKQIQESKSKRGRMNKIATCTLARDE